MLDRVYGQGLCFASIVTSRPAEPSCVASSCFLSPCAELVDTDSDDPNGGSVNSDFVY